MMRREESLCCQFSFAIAIALAVVVAGVVIQFRCLFVGSLLVCVLECLFL